MPRVGLASSVATLALVLGGACSGQDNGSLVTCSRLDELLGRTNPAELTGPPSFSALEIAPGDPLSLMIPVNEHTRSVSVDVRSVDRQSAVNVPSRETDGAETLVFPMQTTGFPPGIYLLRVATLDAARPPPESSSYSTSAPDGTYRLTAYTAPEFNRTCLTEIPVASFALVASDANDLTRD